MLPCISPCVPDGSRSLPGSQHGGVRWESHQLLEMCIYHIPSINNNNNNYMTLDCQRLISLRTVCKSYRHLHTVLATQHYVIIVKERK